MADGKAGDIRIDVGTLTLANRAVIDGNTVGNGAAGHVTIIAPILELPEAASGPRRRGRAMLAPLRWTQDA